MTVSLVQMPRPSHEDVADGLRALADQVERGEVEADVALIVLAHQGGTESPWAYGRPVRATEAVGLLHAAAFCTLKDCTE